MSKTEEKWCYALRAAEDEPYSDDYVVSIFQTQEAAESEKKRLEDLDKEKCERYNSIKEEQLKYEDYIYQNDLDGTPDCGVMEKARHFGVTPSRVQEVLDEPYYYPYVYRITKENYIER